MLRKKNFLHFFFYRTIRVDILTVFLSLFIFSFLLVLLFTYVKSSKSILEFSVGTIERASAVVLGRVAETIRDCEQMPEIAADFFPSLENLTFENQKLLAYLESVIKFDTNFTSFYIATVDGGFIAVNNLELTGQTHYISDRLKILPSPKEGFGKILYSLTFVDRTQQPARSVWYYKNDKFQTVDKEEIIGTLYDPRVRPWYIGAVKSEGLHWENITEHYVTGGEKGINVAKKILNEKKELIGVVGANMSLNFFSKFLLSQKIGQTGGIFVLDRSGEILLPLKEDRQISSKRIAQEKELTRLAYQQFLESQHAAFRIEKEGIEYLSYLTKIPVAQGLEWYVVIIVPLSDFFIDLLHTQTMIAVITLMILVVSAIFVSYFSKRISSPIVQLADEVNEIRHLRFNREKRVVSNIKEIDLMEKSIGAMRAAIHSFSRYVPKKVVGQLIEQGQEIILGGEKKEITIFFSDIKEFTAITEEYDPEIIMPLLAEYFDGCSKIILEQGGTIDKYTGDGIMAFWGAPLEFLDHPSKACIAALYCHTYLAKLNQIRKEKGLPQFLTRIGINTGTVIVGNIGTSERMNYTAMGDAVNTASRLQTINKEFQTEIIISETVYRKTEDLFLVRPLDMVSIRGKKEKIKIYELVAKKGGDLRGTPEQKELCTLFSEAYEAYHSGRIEQAKGFFETLLQKFPTDFPTQMYLQRIANSRKG